MKELKIKKTIVDGSTERKLLIGMVVSTRFLKEAVTFYDSTLIETKAVKRIADWCVDYYQRYNKAPGKTVKDIFDAWEDKLQPAERDLIEDLLADLSNEYERANKLNVPYLLDLTEKHFRSLSLQRMASQVKSLADENVEEAESLVTEFRRIGRPSSLGVNPFKSADAIREAFESVETPLLEFPGKLGELMNRIFSRDQFIAFMGPEKRGKTWWLNEVAIRAAKARCNVALFQIGDMSQGQVIVRLCERLVGKSSLRYYEGKPVPEPVLDCWLNQTGKCKRKRCKPIMEKWEQGKLLECFQEKTKHIPCIECKDERFFKGSFWYRNRRWEKALTWREAFKVGHKFLKRTTSRDFKLSVHPADQLNVTGLKNILDNWEMFEGFVPDVIVIDYADNLAPEDRREEYRHQQNRTWKLLRGLSQERHCLVVAATQANAASYDQSTLTMKNYSEDKRKFAHVTAMFGLNQTSAEKRLKITRINTIVMREGEFHSEDEVRVAQCLQMGRPLLFSF